MYPIRSFAACYGAIQVGAPRPEFGACLLGVDPIVGRNRFDHAMAIPRGERIAVGIQQPCRVDLAMALQGFEHAPGFATVVEYQRGLGILGQDFGDAGELLQRFFLAAAQGAGEQRGKTEQQADRAAQHDQENELFAQGPIGQVREDIHNHHFPKILAARFSIWLESLSPAIRVDARLISNCTLFSRWSSPILPPRSAKSGMSEMVRTGLPASDLRMGMKRRCSCWSMYSTSHELKPRCPHRADGSAIRKCLPCAR